MFLLSFNRFRFLLSFRIIWFRWLDQFKFWSSVMPKNLVSGLFVIVCMSSCSLISLDFLSFWNSTQTVLFKFSVSLLILKYFIISFMSSRIHHCRYTRFLYVLYRVVSSANRMHEQWCNCLCKSLVKIRKRRGPKQDPWGGGAILDWLVFWVFHLFTTCYLAFSSYQSIA